MALFKIFKGKSTDLGKTGTTALTQEGYAYFTPDTGKFYIDVASSNTPIVGPNTSDGSNRICINDSMERLAVLRCGKASTLGVSTIPQLPDNNIIIGGGEFIPGAATIFLDCGTATDTPADAVLYDCMP